MEGKGSATLSRQVNCRQYQSFSKPEGAIRRNKAKQTDHGPRTAASPSHHSGAGSARPSGGASEAPATISSSRHKNNSQLKVPTGPRKRLKCEHSAHLASEPVTARGSAPRFPSAPSQGQTPGTQCVAHRPVSLKTGENARCRAHPALRDQILFRHPCRGARSCATGSETCPCRLRPRVLRLPM